MVASSKDISQDPLPSNFRLSLLDVPQVTRRSRKKKTRCVFSSSSTVPRVALSPSWVPQIQSELPVLGPVSMCPVGTTSFGCHWLLDSLTVPVQKDRIKMCQFPLLQLALCLILDFNSNLDQRWCKHPPHHCMWQQSEKTKWHSGNGSEVQI